MVRSLTRSFADLARLMGEVEGRKYVVYLSEGFDSSPALGQGPPRTTRRRSIRRRYGGGTTSRIIASTDATGSDDAVRRHAARRTPSRRCSRSSAAPTASIQAVDIGGLRGAGNDQGFQRAERQATALLNMAKSTGGELYENFNDLSAAMGQMLRRTGVTYVLAFQPDSAQAGRLLPQAAGGAQERAARRAGGRPAGLLRAAPLQGAAGARRSCWRPPADLMRRGERRPIATSVLAAPFQPAAATRPTCRW